MAKPTIKPSLPRGTRDFLPEQMLRRQYVMDVIERVYRKYSFEPLQTPTMEKLSVLGGKYGDEGEQLIFKILKRRTALERVGQPGGPEAVTVTDFADVADLALRYDLTVPLARVVAMYQHELTLPFKRFQIQPVWRADRPQKGRYREFYQCDADVVGTNSMLADAELLAIMNEVLTTLGFPQFTIRLNNRKILTGLVEYAGATPDLATSIIVAIDKLDKIGLSGVENELQERGVSAGGIARILNVLALEGSNTSLVEQIRDLLSVSETGRQGIEETQEVLTYADHLGIPEANLRFDLTLARGLSYYTGPIFETVVESPNVGSLTGGGRYNQLIGMFLGRDIPATGTSFGIERIIDVLTELDMLPVAKTSTAALVTTFNADTQAASIRLVSALREAGVNTELYFKAKDGIGKQLKYADRKGIRFAIIAGPDELAQGQATVKDLHTGDQVVLAHDALASHIRQQRQG